MVTRRVNLTSAYMVMYHVYGITNPCLVELPDNNPAEIFRVHERIVERMDANLRPVYTDRASNYYAFSYHIIEEHNHRSSWNCWQILNGPALYVEEITTAHLGNILRFCFNQYIVSAKHLVSRHFNKITWTMRRGLLEDIYHEFKYRLRNYLP